MSRGLDKNDLLREKAVKELSKDSPREKRAPNHEELVKGSEAWQRAREEVLAKMKAKAEKMREETRAFQKENERFGNNGDYESSHDARSEGSNPNHTY